MRRIFPILFLVAILLVKNSSTGLVPDNSFGSKTTNNADHCKSTCGVWRIGACAAPASSATQPQPGPCDAVSGTEKTICEDCINNQKGAYTALGCIPVSSPAAFISKVLKLSIGLVGGLAFLLILYGGFQVLTSSGEPEKLNTGKEIIFSAIAGLLMIVFSLIILRIIGYDILQIPQFIEK
jgi:hypothetical protein